MKKGYRGYRQIMCLEWGARQHQSSNPQSRTTVQHVLLLFVIRLNMFLYLLNDVGVYKQSPHQTLDLFVFTVSQSESYSHLCSPKVRKGRAVL